MFSIVIVILESGGLLIKATLYIRVIIKPIVKGTREWQLMLIGTKKIFSI